tara:strand:+ start:59 stop:964 length:906 start_codon:yes stop_codon:yes gene_type:complete
MEIHFAKATTEVTTVTSVNSTTPLSEMDTIKQITTSETAFRAYTAALNLFLQTSPPPTVRSTIYHARTLCKDLPSDDNIYTHFQGYGTRDKGNLGKCLEYALFGQKPNCNSNPDFLELGKDLKVTKFKTLRNNNFNAKERLTITNIKGNPKNNNFGKNIMDKDNLCDTNYYGKIRKGLLIIVDNGTATRYKTFDEVMNMCVLYLMNYDIEQLPLHFQEQIKIDYQNIRTCIRTKTLTQRGQIYLHMPKHASGGGQTRAFAFTNKFVTLMLAYYRAQDMHLPIDDILVTRGRSVSIKSSAFN